MDTKQKVTLLVMLLITAICTVFVSLNSDQSNEIKKISLQESERIQIVPIPAERAESLKIAVSAMISPCETG